MNRPFRVLAIDGGGMKGVYACSYLSLLEEHFGNPLHEHFDLIAGTSTGGIIALGLGAGKSAGEILKFYREYGARVFRRSYGPVPLVSRALSLGSAHRQIGLRDALTNVFCDLKGNPYKMKDAKTRLCIPAVRTSDCQPRVFKAICPEDSQSIELTADLDTSIIDVALATSAAPLYLPSHRFSEGNAVNCYVDGGLWANNPALVGYVEAKTILAQRANDFTSVEVLSIGLPGFVNTPTPPKSPRWNRLIQGMLEQTMESGKSSIDYQLRILTQSAPEDFYYRVKPSPIGPEMQKLFQLDNASQRAISELMTLGKNDAERDKRGEIKNIFK